ncbi:MAG: DUF4136 domain-containing protein [Verrucomicrobia bacterium]|nr:MAG: DUF4136 domain-containing protein [Verrucomicrobiota bacterium]
MKNLFVRDSVKLLVLVALAFVAGCKTPIHTDYKADANFAAYHTFALMPLPATGPADDPGLILRVGKPAQEAMTTALTAKGFQSVAREHADFVVNLVGSSVPKVEVTDWGYNRTTWTRRYGYVPVHVGEVDVRNYEEKTLAIEIFDGKSHELVWVGRRTEKSGGKATAEGVKEAITEVLAKFPPAPNK